MIKLECIRPENSISPAEEGLFRRLSYIFTRDFKCAEKINDLVNILQNMKSEDEKKLREMTCDFRMQDKPTTLDILAFANASMQWANQHVEKFKELLRVLGFRDVMTGGFASRQKKVRQEFYKMYNAFVSKYPFDTYSNLVSGRTPVGVKLAEDKTYSQLSFNKNDIIKLAKDFKISCSGHLATMKKIESLARMSMQSGNIIYVDMYEVLDLLNLGIRAYKFVDYFLYYTYKELA